MYTLLTERTRFKLLCCIAFFFISENLEFYGANFLCVTTMSIYSCSALNEPVYKAMTLYYYACRIFTRVRGMVGVN